MKKIFMLTLVFLASVSFATLQAKEGKKKKGVVEQKEAVQLLTPNDTLSYVAGMTATEGLLPYLQQQFGVDSTGMADFLRGFNEAQQHVNDAAFKAYVAGMQIAEMVNSRILPNMRQGLEGTNDSIQRATFIKGFVDALHRALCSTVTKPLPVKMRPIRRRTKHGWPTMPRKKASKRFLRACNIRCLSKAKALCLRTQTVWL